MHAELQAIIKVKNSLKSQEFNPLRLLPYPFVKSSITDMLDLHGRHTHTHTHTVWQLVKLVELFDFLLEENFSSMKIDIFPGPKQLKCFCLLAWQQVQEHAAYT